MSKSLFIGGIDGPEDHRFSIAVLWLDLDLDRVPDKPADRGFQDERIALQHRHIAGRDGKQVGQGDRFPCREGIQHAPDGIAPG